MKSIGSGGILWKLNHAYHNEQEYERELKRIKECHCGEVEVSKCGPLHYCNLKSKKGITHP